MTPEPQPPRRPADGGFDALGFHPRPATRWLDPGRLARTTVRETLASVAEPFTDRREVLAALDPRPEPVEDLDLSGRSELWIDHVADTGDGFASTYPVAWLLGHDELTVDGHPDPLPAGDLLVLGGDMVYPIASDEEYRDRLAGPYRAALPWRGPGATRDAVAIPGDHDWYDGMGAFARRFCQQGWLGAWQLHQRRSYVAVRLPHDWWIWGIDIALAGRVDGPQLAYFDAIARRAAGLAADAGNTARVVLCTAVPTWLDARPGAPDEVRVDPAVDYVESAIARRHGVRVVAVIAGDSHFYARHAPTGDGPHRIVCGGGGAFLFPTDHVPERLSVARRAWPGHERDEELVQRGLEPSRRRSRRLRWRSLWFGFRNGAFPVLTALAYLLWLLPTPARAVAAVALLGVLTALARQPSLVRGALFGVPHTAAHLGVMALAGLVADRIADDGSASVWGEGASLLVAGALLAPVVMGLYFVVAGRLAGVNDNEAFSAIRVREHKAFLRLHLDAGGAMRLHAIGVPAPPPRSGWRVEPAGEPGDPWFAPVDGEGPRATLIDGPVDLT